MFVHVCPDTDEIYMDRIIEKLSGMYLCVLVCV
jgi:hypothetical protein